MNEERIKELPRYKAHKVVHALQIRAISVVDCAYYLSFVEEGYEPIKVKWDWYSKHDPREGGYYVVYKDGYVSWSPQKAFEEGYTLLED